MIPQIKRLLRERNAVPTTAQVSCIKLHNGVAHRNPKVSFVVFADGEPKLFLKTVREPKDSEVIRHANACLLSASSWVTEKKLSVRMPQSLWLTEIGASNISAESIVLGRALQASELSETTKAFALLEAWARAGAGEAQSVSELKTLIDTFRRESRIASSALNAELDRVFTETLQKAGGDAVRLPRIPAHGDCTPSNFLVDTEGRLGLIDWDRFGDITLPLFDLLTFIERVAPKRANPYQLYREQVLKHLEILGLDQAAFPLIVFLMTVATEWRKRLRFHPYEIERLDEAFLDNVKLAMGWAASI